MNSTSVKPGWIRTTMLFLTTTAIAGSLMLQAQDFPQVDIKLVASGFNDPVDITHAGDSRLFIVEQRGLIRIVQADGTIQNDAFIDIRDRVKRSGSEQGLLGLAFHPQYASNGYLYVNYTTTGDATRVSRFRVMTADPDKADPNSEEILMTINQPFKNHNGGDLAFGPDGYLYITNGDGGSAGDPGNRAQDGDDLLGKILRIDVDGGTPYAIPADNPFVNDNNVADEIWSLGWRNPWRFSFDRLTGDMWVADVGQNRREEVCFEPAGKGGLNYGWRCREGELSFNTGGCGSVTDYVEPVFTYKHTSGLGKSITGGFVYRGVEHPSLTGIYFFGDFEAGNVWGIRADTNGGFVNQYLGQFLNTNSISTFGENAAGEVFVADYNLGLIWQLVDRATSVDPFANRMAVNIAPQPANEILTLTFNQLPLSPIVLTIRDLQGKLVTQQVFAPNQQLELSVQDMTPGVYLIRGSNQQMDWVEKIVVE